MRLFVALELNQKVIANLTELLRRLRPAGVLRWVHPQNMHVTLKYIGDWPDERLHEVTRALSKVKMNKPVNVTLAGLGFFPNARAPRVFWVGAENVPPLRQLASGVDAELQALGVPPEVRPYQPHLTLARIRPNQPLDDLHRFVEDLPSREFGTISPDHFTLFESELTPSGPVYRRVEEFSFLLPTVEAAYERAELAGKV